MIIITIMIMNNEYIWLASLNELQIKVSSAIAYDFNQLIYATRWYTQHADIHKTQPTNQQAAKWAGKAYICPNIAKSAYFWAKMAVLGLNFFGSEQNLDKDHTLVWTWLGPNRAATPNRP